MKTVEVKAYNFYIHLCIGDEAKKIIQYVNRKVKRSGSKVSEDDTIALKTYTKDLDTAAFYLGMDLSGHGLIWFNMKHVEHINPITLSHELIHACIDIFDHIGSSVNKETQEPFCYLHDFLMGECLVELDKVRNGDNIKAQQSVRAVQKLGAGDKSEV